MKIIISLILLATLSACADFKDHNEMIRQGNVTMFQAYGEAMAKQTTEGGRIAVQSAYLTRVGQQDYVRPETALDYSNGLLPYANLFMQGYTSYKRAKPVPTYRASENGSIYVTNEQSSRNSQTVKSYNTEHEDSYNTEHEASYNQTPTGSYNTE